jgi:hypothetical protein
MILNCPACGREHEVEWDPEVSDFLIGDVRVEAADDGSGWFVTCPPNARHDEPERFAVTWGDVGRTRPRLARVTITRNEAGSLELEAVRPDGRTFGLATYTDERDWLPTLRYMIEGVLPAPEPQPTNRGW